MDDPQKIQDNTRTHTAVASAKATYYIRLYSTPQNMQLCGKVTCHKKISTTSNIAAEYARVFRALFTVFSCQADYRLNNDEEYLLVLDNDHKTCALGSYYNAWWVA